MVEASLKHKVCRDKLDTITKMCSRIENTECSDFPKFSVLEKESAC